MSARAWVNVILLVVFAALGALVFYESGHEKEETAEPVTALTPASITRVTIGAERRTLTLAREAEGWRLTAPIAAPANEVRVNNVLQLAAAASHTHFAVAGRDLAAYGLAETAVRVTFNDIELQLGDIDPVNRWRYVRAGGTIHLIDDNYYFDVIAGLEGFVSRALVPPDQRITAITLPDFGVSRDAAGGWAVTPPRTDISSDAVQAFVDAWQRAQAMSVEPRDKVPAQGRVRIALDKPAELALDIVAREPGLILGHPDWGLQFHFTREQAEKLLRLSAHEPPPAADAGQ